MLMSGGRTVKASQLSGLVDMREVSNVCSAVNKARELAKMLMSKE
jgi:hypothetical protein